ncbi:MAG: glycosyltransferase [Deltaproteobacteria bacterium]|nr:glycosyltransferase [Deltaproteobacteria bacterium]
MSEVSVLMPVHNAGLFVEEAVRSVLQQTFTDFELVVMDDGCTDDTLSRIAQFKDPRIRVIRNERNLGIAPTLNRALDLVRTEWIARMDADDICEPDRLATQVAFMRAHPNLVVAGGLVRLFGDRKPVIVPQPHGVETVRAFLLFGNALVHPTVMFRRSLLERHNLRYDPSYSCTEDYELWTRAADVAAVDNQLRVVLNLRVHGANITANMKPVMLHQTWEILRRQLGKLGIEPSDSELERHYHLGWAIPAGSLHELKAIKQWVVRLIGSNQANKAYPIDTFREVAGQAWFRFCRNSTRLGYRVFHAYRSGELAPAYQPTTGEMSSFLASLMFHSIIGLQRSVKERSA